MSDVNKRGPGRPPGRKKQRAFIIYDNDVTLSLT